MREDVIEPGEESMRVAIRANRVAERMGLRRVEAMTGRDRAAEDADGCKDE